MAIRKLCRRCRSTVGPRVRVCPKCAGTPAYKASYRGPDKMEHSRMFPFKSEAARWLGDIKEARRRDVWFDPAAGRMLFSEFADEWLGSVVHLRPSTRHRYGSLLRSHLLPILGALPVNTIRPLDVSALMSSMLRAGLSPTTAHHAYVLLSEILKAAQRDGRIGKNPAADFKPPARRRQEQRYLSADEVWKLAEAVRPQYRALVLVGAYGALRWGELTGLRVPRLRLLQRKIDVLETLVEVGSELVSGPPKTGARTVSIPAPLAEELARHLTTFPGDAGGLVFTGPDGGPLRHPNFYRREWRPALQRARLDPRTRIHDLRHSAVALAIATGAHPKEIQELCGHASITTTLNVYGHLFEGLQDRLAERLAATYAESRAAWLRPVASGEVVAIRTGEASQGL